MRKDWFKKAVVYQVYPMSFRDSDGDGVGDLNGIVEKLGYIKALGADVIWLNPIYRSPCDDNGYDIADYRDINPAFGTMTDFELLLARAHALGLKIMMDLVVNHTSDEHQWFLDSARSLGKYKDFYIWRPGKAPGVPPNNWGATFGGSAWRYNEVRGMWYLHTFSPKQPDLNWDNPQVRQEVYSLMRFWLEKGVDGFRMDVINYISKTEEMPDGKIMANGYGDFRPFCLNGPHVHAYLKEMHREVLSHYPVITVGETPGVEPADAMEYAGFASGELQMVFQFSHMALDHGPYGKWGDRRFDLVRLKAIEEKWQSNLHGKAWNSLYWDNHDQPRIVSRFGSEQYRVESAKMLAICLHCMEGTPYIYQGEELGMTNAHFTSIAQYRDLESLNAWKEFVVSGMVGEADMLRYLARLSRDNARTPMQWDGSEKAGFTSGKPWIDINGNARTINAEQEEKDKDSVLWSYRNLITLRKRHAIIREGDFHLLDAEDPQVFAYVRTWKNQRLEVFCNFSDEESAPCTATEGAELLIANYSDTPSRTFALRPYEARVYLTVG